MSLKIHDCQDIEQLLEQINNAKRLHNIIITLLYKYINRIDILGFIHLLTIINQCQKLRFCSQ